MTYIEIARQLDAQRRPVEAAWAYEMAYVKSQVDRDTVLDLAAIYLTCQDPGFAAAYDMPQQYVNAASVRLFELLAHAQRVFVRDAEIESWNLYARERVYFDDVDDTLYEHLAVEGRSTLAMIRLYISLGGQRFARELRVTQTLLTQEATERERYLLSLLRSAALPP